MVIVMKTVHVLAQIPPVVRNSPKCYTTTGIITSIDLQKHVSTGEYLQVLAEWGLGLVFLVRAAN